MAEHYSSAAIQAVVSHNKRAEERWPGKHCTRSHLAQGRLKTAGTLPWIDKPTSSIQPSFYCTLSISSVRGNREKMSSCVAFKMILASYHRYQCPDVYRASWGWRQPLSVVLYRLLPTLRPGSQEVPPPTRCPRWMRQDCSLLCSLQDLL